jgi:hypothetical protein
MTCKSGGDGTLVPIPVLARWLLGLGIDLLSRRPSRSLEDLVDDWPGDTRYFMFS